MKSNSGLALVFFMLLPLLGCGSSLSPALALHAADNPWELSTLTNQLKPQNSPESFVLGKALFLLSLHPEARPYLEAASRRNQVWSDESQWLLAQISLKSDPREAARHLRGILKRESGSSWYPRALIALSNLMLEGRLEPHTRTLIEAAGLPSTTPANQGRYLLLASKSASPKERRALLIKALKLELYDSTGATITKMVLELERDLHLDLAERVELAAGLIRDNKEKQALVRLNAIPQAQLNPEARIRYLSLRCWIERRMKAWQAALKTTRELEALSGKEARLAALEQRFRVFEGQNDLNGMLKAARELVKLDKTRARAWWRILCDKEKRAIPRSRLALEYLALWPGEYFGERHASEGLVQAWLEKNLSEFNSMAPEALTLIQEPRRRATLVYHLNPKAQDRIIMTEPLGYYHYLIGTNYQNDTLVGQVIEKSTNWQELATASFLASPQKREQIFNRFKSEASKLPDQKIILISDKLDPDLLARLLDAKAARVFKKLYSTGLWSEALDEILARYPAGNPTLSAQGPDYLIQLARLAARASRYNVEIWATWVAIRALGWHYNLAALEHALGGTVFTRLFPLHYSELVSVWSERFKLDPLLVHALIRQESAYNRGIASWAGAVGLMQLMPSTASGLAVGQKLKTYDLKHPDHNIQLGCAMLKWLRDSYGNDESDILIGYNSGPGNIKRWKNNYRSRWGLEPILSRYVETIPYDETKNYVKLVMSNLMLYRYLYR